jgi:putative flippase GtrA
MVERDPALQERWPGVLASLMRVGRFGLVGIAASATYAILALLLIEGAGLPSWAGSALAYVLAIPVSFFGQKHFTFRSHGHIASEMPAFLLLQAANIGLAAGVMAVATNVAGLPHWLGVLAVVAVIPAVTYVALTRSVFLHRNDRVDSRPETRAGDGATGPRSP